MNISPTLNGSFIAFQHYNGTRKNSQGRTVTKVGFVCEANTRAAALDGLIWTVADHCARTDEHPADIFEGQAA